MENNTVMRSMIVDFLHCDTGGKQGFYLMGMGFTSLDENPNAQAEQRAYINDRSVSSIIRGYETQFPFATDLIQSEPPIMKILDIGRNQRRGSAAEAEYVRTEAFLSTGIADVHPARKFRVSIEVTNTTGEGAQLVECSGNLNQVGDFTPGAFSIATRTFYPGTVDDNGVLTVTVEGQTVKLRNSLFVECVSGAGGLGFGSFGAAADAAKDDGKDKDKGK